MTGASFHSARLPFEPLERAVVAGHDVPGECTTGHVARRLHTSREVVYKWRRRGLTITTADRLAVHLGLHPAIVWPTEWSDAA